jgi:hypothetical protein
LGEWLAKYICSPVIGFILYLVRSDIRIYGLVILPLS